MQTIDEINCVKSIRTFVLVNNDLQMSKGLMSAQVAHVILRMAKDIEADRMLPEFPKFQTKRYQKYQTWLERDVIVVKKASEQEMQDLATELPTGSFCVYKDTGTFIGGTPRITCMACYPGMHDETLFKDFKLA